jgi:hypothetical protein
LAEQDLDYGNGQHHSFDGSIESLRRYIASMAEQRLGDRARLLSDAVDPLLPHCRVEGQRLGTPDAAYLCAGQALQIVDDLQLAVTSNNGWMPEGHGGVLWRHNDTFPDFRKVEFDSLGVNRPALEHVAAEYLSRSWLSNGHIDWVVLDALSRLELVEFDYAAEGQKFDTTASPIVKWLFAGGSAVVIELLVLAATVWWLWHEYSIQSENRTYWLGAAGVYYVVVAVLWGFKIRRNRPMIAARKEALEKVGTLKVLLRKAYWELKGPVLHPTRVRDALRAAEAGGVSWPSPIWSVFQEAIDRNPGVWLTGYKDT